MNAQGRPEAAPAATWALEEIAEEPRDFDRPLLRNYPAMKLGAGPAIEFFSRRLAGQAARIVDAAEGRWVLTGPPYLQLPSAANLLARRVQQLLVDGGRPVALHELRLAPPPDSIHGGEEFERFCNYSRSSLQQRIEMRAQEQPRILADAPAERFGGRHVLVVNDINVTGTAQRSLAAALAGCGASSCRWLYIFQVETSLGLRCPQVEFQINSSRMQDRQDFARLLRDEQTRHTAFCLSRLLGRPEADFRSLVELLDPGTCEKLLGLAWLEGRYDSPYFSDKLACLAAACRTPSLP